MEYRGRVVDHIHQSEASTNLDCKGDSADGDFHESKHENVNSHLKYRHEKLRGCKRFSDCVDNEINNSKHSLRSNTKDYGGKTH
jgi:hypothetical protein